MRCLAILIAFAALGTAQTSESRPASQDPQGRPTRPTDPLSTPRVLEIIDPTTETRPRDSKKYAAGVARGRAEADEELKANKAKLWNSGMFIPGEMVDRKTGLYHSGFGCVVDDELVGRVEGHNAKIAEYIRDHGLPKNSFKPWEKELFGLKEYFEGRSRTDKPIRMIVEGPAARSLDGQFVVRLVKRPFKSPGKRPTDDWVTKISPCLVVNGLDDEASRISFFREDAELFWGPKGSWFAVLRSKNRRGHGMDYFAIDLRGLRNIREELGDPPLDPRSR